jgi:hypothetical protein
MNMVKTLFPLIILAAATLGVCGEEPFIASVKLNNAPMSEVVNLLRRQYGWNVIVENQEQLNKLPPITLSFERVPVWVLVRYASMAVGWKYRIEDDIITIGQNVVKTKLYYPADFKNRSVLEDVPWGTRMSIGTTYYLPVGYQPPSITVNSDGSTIAIVSPMPIFGQYFSGIEMSTVEDTAPAVKPYKPRKHTQRLLPEPPEEKLEDELKTKHFPLTLGKLQELKINVDIEQMPLREALETIRRLSAAADQNGEGINIFIKPFPGIEAIQVDMVMNKTSLYRVLQYLCDSAGLKFHASPYTIVIYKPE